MVGQTGEYLVAAELARRGLIATTFTGNVPHYDIVASDETGRHVSVQVKSSRSPSWMVGNVTNYCEITFDGKRQIVGAPKECPVSRLVVVMVHISKDRADKFFVCKWDFWRDKIIEHHRIYLDQHKGVRPRKWDSLHAAVTEEMFAEYRDCWDLVKESLL